MNITIINTRTKYTKNIFSEKVSDLIYIDIHVGHMSINFSDYIRIEGNGAWC